MVELHFNDARAARPEEENVPHTSHILARLTWLTVWLLAVSFVVGTIVRVLGRARSGGTHAVYTRTICRDLLGNNPEFLGRRRRNTSRVRASSIWASIVVFVARGTSCGLLLISIPRCWANSACLAWTCPLATNRGMLGVSRWRSILACLVTQPISARSPKPSHTFCLLRYHALISLFTFLCSLDLNFLK